MSDFKKYIKDFSTTKIPMIEKSDYIPSFTNSKSAIFKGKTYYTESFTGGIITSLFANGLQKPTNNTIMFAMKSNSENLYLLFVYITPNLLRLYINDKVSLDGAVIMNSLTDGGVNQYYGTFSIITNSYGIALSYQYEYKRTPYISAIGATWNGIEMLLGEYESIITSPTYGNASDKGGYSGGSFDNSSDTIAIPTKPTIGVSNIGFVNVYCPSQNALVNLGSELFPDFTPPPTPPASADVAEALQMGLNNVVENISNFTNMFINSKLIDYVIDCHCIPVQPTNTGAENIKIGFKSFTPTAPKATVDYVDFDCGTLNIKEYYSNFIDYVGTRAKLYLPFVGFVPIENEYFQNGLLQVIYRFNIIDGSFMAYVLSSSSKSELSNSVIASYGGNACVHIPITGLNYANMVSGIASGTVATIATASINKGLGAVTTVNSALNTLSSKPAMQSSNGYNSTSAYLGIRYPYLIIEREVSNFSELYTNENGLPCNITKKISDLSGFIQMDNCHMETLPCMEEEKEMIQSLLASGIIV